MIKKVLFLQVFIVTASCKMSGTKEILGDGSITSNFSIEILDDEALQVLDSKSTLKIIASGFDWVEGPLWIEDGQYLLFSDIPKNKVYKLNAQNDTVTYLNPSGFDVENYTGFGPGSNGLLLSPQGQLVLMQHGERRVGVMKSDLDNPSPTYASLINSFEGKRLNSPNDGVFDKNGNLYFTDPPYGLRNLMEDEDKELDFQGVYCLLRSGELILIDKELSFPNGITLSSDNKLLYVVVSDDMVGGAWFQYSLEAPGKAVDKKLFYDVKHLLGKPDQQGLPDGLKANSKGYIFATGPGGLWIFNKEAKPIARVYTGLLTSNCALTTNEKRLFLTADSYILALDLK
ncbi:SMP-30/gluconolactonase/LRE family protein [Maribacter dokdonensis]|uniref:SMP-30/gluconolactonase/LRE family protein n=1 Tax=Maribacter dokdonensis TaxID=320912 RepID=UPI003297CA85